jgi:hypothetical protein
MLGFDAANAWLARRAGPVRVAAGQQDSSIDLCVTWSALVTHLSFWMYGRQHIMNNQGVAQLFTELLTTLFIAILVPKKDRFPMGLASLVETNLAKNRSLGVTNPSCCRVELAASNSHGKPEWANGVSWQWMQRCV